MLSIEQVEIKKVADTYNYEPGQSGIDFTEVLDRVKKGETEFSVIGGTGREIHCRFSLNKPIESANLHYVHISDGDYDMTFVLNHYGVLSHDIVTRIDGNESLEYTNEKGRHRDFSGDGFIGFSLALCEALGSSVEKIGFQTGPFFGDEKLDNFKKWNSERKRLMSEGEDEDNANLEAILSMPSYKSYQRHKFGQIVQHSFRTNRFLEDYNPDEDDDADEDSVHQVKGEISYISFMLEGSE